MPFTIDPPSARPRLLHQGAGVRSASDEEAALWDRCMALEDVARAELLAACERALRHEEDLGVTDGDLPPLATQLRAAIKRARGE